MLRSSIVPIAHISTLSKESFDGAMRVFPISNALYKFRFIRNENTNVITINEDGLDTLDTLDTSETSLR